MNHNLDIDDCELLREVMKSSTSMEVTAKCVSLFEGESDYPIKSADELVGVFRILTRGGPFLQACGCRISERQIRRDIPQGAYPIQSRGELISAFLVAFELNLMIQRGFVVANGQDSETELQSEDGKP